MKRFLIYAGILFVCSIQACNSSSAPGTTASDSTTNDSAYDKPTATERVVKPGVKKENINNRSTNSESTNSENLDTEKLSNENFSNENTKRKNTKEHAPKYNPIQQDTLNKNNSVHLNENEVPAAVISALHMRYPTVPKVKWVMNDKKNKTLYIAHWQMHKNKMIAVFAENGMFIKEKQQ